MAYIPDLPPHIVARSPRTLEEIASLPPIDSPECVAEIKQRGPELTPETLVFVLREAYARGLKPLLRAAAKAMLGEEKPDGGIEGGHTEAYIYKSAQRWHFATNERWLDTLREKTLDKMWDHILAGRARRPLWEARFGWVMSKLVTQYARRIPAKIARERRTISELSALSGHTFEIGQTTESKEPFYGPAEFHGVPRWILLDAIERLPEPARTCIYLKWIEGYQMQSKKGKPSVSARTGKNVRTVSNYIQRGTARLRSDPRVRVHLTDNE